MLRPKKMKRTLKTLREEGCLEAPLLQLADSHMFDCRSFQKVNQIRVGKYCFFNIFVLILHLIFYAAFSNSDHTE